MNSCRRDGRVTSAVGRRRLSRNSYSIDASHDDPRDFASTPLMSAIFLADRNTECLELGQREDREDPRAFYLYTLEIEKVAYK